MGVISMKALLEAGVHFGHQTRRWNPKMGRYIYTSRNGIHIIDLQQTSDFIDVSYKALFDIVAEGGEVLFVGTKKQSQDPIREAAMRSGQYFVTQRWLGGTLTNFKTIKRSIKKLHDLYKMEEDGTFAVLPKKEVIGLKKDMARLEKFLGGIKDMRKLPKAMFIVDPRKERNAILEARKLHIPVFGIVDTNCDPDEVDYIIPANDDALRSVRLIVNKMADAVIEGRGGVVVPVEVKEQPRREYPAKKPYNKDGYKKDGYKKEGYKKDFKRDDRPKPVVVQVSAEKKVEPKKVEVKPVPKKVEVKPVTKKVEVKSETKKEAPKTAPKQESVKVEVKATVDLASKTVAELKALAKEKSLSGYSKLRKAELITELQKVM